MWATNPGLDRVLKIDSRTGQVTAVNLEPLAMPEVTEVDRQRRQTVRASQNSAPPDTKHLVAWPPIRTPTCVGGVVHQRSARTNRHQDESGEGIPASDAVQLAVCDGRGQERHRLDQHDEPRRADEVRSRRRNGSPNITCPRAAPRFATCRWTTARTRRPSGRRTTERTRWFASSSGRRPLSRRGR